MRDLFAQPETSFSILPSSEEVSRAPFSADTTTPEVYDENMELQELIAPEMRTSYSPSFVSPSPLPSRHFLYQTDAEILLYGPLSNEEEGNLTVSPYNTTTPEMKHDLGLELQDLSTPDFASSQFSSSPSPQLSCSPSPQPFSPPELPRAMKTNKRVDAKSLSTSQSPPSLTTTCTQRRTKRPETYREQDEDGDEDGEYFDIEPTSTRTSGKRKFSAKESLPAKKPRTKKGVEDALPKCKYCPMNFSRGHDARRHEKTCGNNPKKSSLFKCSECARPFSRKDAFFRHLDNKKFFSCVGVCERAGLLDVIGYVPKSSR